MEGGTNQGSLQAASTGQGASSPVLGRTPTPGTESSSPTQPAREKDLTRADRTSRLEAEGRWFSDPDYAKEWLSLRARLTAWWARNITQAKARREASPMPPRERRCRSLSRREALSGSTSRR